MDRTRLFASAAAGLGAALLGLSLAGVASVDRDLQAAVQAPAPVSTQFMDDDHGGGCGHREHERLRV